MWFSCTDVAKAVGYADAQQAVSTLMLDRKELSEIQTPVSLRGFDFQALFGRDLSALILDRCPKRTPVIISMVRFTGGGESPPPR